MNTYQRWRQAFLAAFVLVLLLTIWVILAPIQLGGQAAYVIIDGKSMEPGFHLGDLVVVRRAPTYQIGDMVAYDNAELNRYVFHRIIDERGNHFVLKGDNNEWTDSYQPGQSELVGKFWLHLPGVGKWVRWARLPSNMGLMAGIIGGLLALGLVIGQRPQGKNPMEKKSIKEWFRNIREQGFRRFMARISESRHLKSLGSGEQATPDLEQTRDFKRLGQILEGLFFGLGSLAFVSLILAYFAFARPTQRTVTDNINFQHVGMFSYSAAAPTGLYDSNSVRAGEPLFPKFTCIVNIRFSYALAGIQPESLAGSYQLSAKVLDEQSGWQRTIPLTAQTPFTGKTFAISAPLDVCQVEALAANLEQTTDLHPPYYILSIAPVVTLNGKIAGHDLADTFSPHLDFRFDKVVFSVVYPDPQSNPRSEERRVGKECR